MICESNYHGDFFPRISEAEVLGFDTEATGLHWPLDKMFGFSTAFRDGDKIIRTYHDIRHTPKAVDWFNYEMSRFEGRLVAHNASFDYKMGTSGGLAIAIQDLDDTCIRASCINEHEFSYQLDALCSRYLGREKYNDIYQDLAQIFGGKPTRSVQIKNLYKAPPFVVAPYAEEDAELALLLWEWQEEEIEKEGLSNIIAFERRVMKPVISAEMRGIRVDEEEAERAIYGLAKEIDSMHKELYALLGKEINVNSPVQVKEVFSPKKNEAGIWEADNGMVLETTEKGNVSLGSESLRAMKGDRRAELILDIRSTIKTKDTFLAGHVLGHSVNGVVYPSINQTKGEDVGTGTGRMSYTDPAMQQIPSRNIAVARIVKPVFLPAEGDTWTSLDQHSFEVRVFAHLVNDLAILARYQENPLSDFHRMVSELTGLPRDATYSGQPNSKQLNLSMIFNSGNGAIAAKMGMPFEWKSFLPKGLPDRPENYVQYRKAGPEATAVIDEYHRQLPGVKKLAKNAEGIAKSFGYVQTKLGRRLRFPGKFKTYKASGITIQATAADINKLMWIIADDMEYGHLILNTHDSYEISNRPGISPSTIRDDLQEKIRAETPWFRVPLVIDLTGNGRNWWDAIRAKKDKKSK